MQTFAKLLVLLGGVLLAVGAILWVASRSSGLKNWLHWFGNLPGDIHIQRQGFTFFAPLTSSILISVVLSLLLCALLFLFRK